MKIDSNFFTKSLTLILCRFPIISPNSIYHYQIQTVNWSTDRKQLELFHGNRSFRCLQVFKEEWLISISGNNSQST